MMNDLNRLGDDMSHRNNPTEIWIDYTIDR